VVILDPRMLTKSYGKVFLDSLPPAAVEIEPFADEE
jgi:Rad3-related DNA helicase